MKSLISSLIICLCLSSCQNTANIQPEDFVVVKNGEKKTFKVNGKSLSLSVSRIDDSRCPESVMCIWAGANVVTLSATLGSISSGETELCSNCESYNDFPSASFEFENLKITLLDSKPYNRAEEEISIKSAYFQIEPIN
jgi:hypothetical protein